jgi:hypothetical protein
VALVAAPDVPAVAPVVLPVVVPVVLPVVLPAVLPVVVGEDIELGDAAPMWAFVRINCPSRLPAVLLEPDVPLVPVALDTPAGCRHPTTVTLRSSCRSCWEPVCDPGCEPIGAGDPVCDPLWAPTPTASAAVKMVPKMNCCFINSS